MPERSCPATQRLSRLPRGQIDVAKFDRRIEKATPVDMAFVIGPISRDQLAL